MVFKWQKLAFIEGKKCLVQGKLSTFELKTLETLILAQGRIYYLVRELWVADCACRFSELF